MKCIGDIFGKWASLSFCVKRKHFPNVPVASVWVTAIFIVIRTIQISIKLLQINVIFKITELIVKCFSL